MSSLSEELLVLLSEISGFHSGDWKDSCLLVRDAMSSVGMFPVFSKNLLPSSSGYDGKHGNENVGFLMAQPCDPQVRISIYQYRFFLCYSFTLKG